MRLKHKFNSDDWPEPDKANTNSTVSLSCLPLLLWRGVVSGAMLHPVIFIMAFPWEIKEYGLIIHHTKYFIFMLLKSMAAACLQFIWGMVCIPNHRHVYWASEQRLPCKVLLWVENQNCSDYDDVLPEAAVAVQVSITGVTAQGGVLVTDAAPWKFILITVWWLMCNGCWWNPTLGCWSLSLSNTSDQQGIILYSVL